MGTQARKLEGRSIDRGRIAEAAACLRDGGLVIFPTETVYGVAANALNHEALERLKNVKERHPDKPFTVHVGAPSDARKYVERLSPLAERLIRKTWPGPLTVVLPAGDPTRAPVIQESSPEHVPSLYFKGDIGIRCPEPAITCALLTEAGVPVVASSANPAGRPPPGDADQAMAMLGGKVDFVIDGGPARYGQASTVVRIEDNAYSVLREGILEKRTLDRLARVHVMIVCAGNTCRSPMAEAIARRLLAERVGCDENELAERGYEVSSAGIAAADGMAASPSAVEVMRERGLNLDMHRSTGLTRARAERADVLFAVTTGILNDMIALAPSIRDKCRLLDERDLEDPIGGDRQAYARCADRIEGALKRHMQEIAL